MWKGATVLEVLYHPSMWPSGLIDDSPASVRTAGIREDMLNRTLPATEQACYPQGIAFKELQIRLPEAP